ncbi:hypothetical protein [robinz microvirus RP_145]|nr:hypothetical protein [robinz microvirus RP_145]
MRHRRRRSTRRRISRRRGTPRRRRSGVRAIRIGHRM